MQIGAGRIGQGQHQAGLAVVGGVPLSRGRGGSNRNGWPDDRPGESRDRLVAIEVERFAHHPLHRPGAGLGGLEIERAVDPRSLFRRWQQLFGEQFQPGIAHRAAFPADEDELLTLETAAEEAVYLGFRVFQRQPALHIVAVVALGLEGPHHDHGEEKHQDRHDPDAVTLIKVGSGVRQLCLKRKVLSGKSEQHRPRSMGHLAEGLRTRSPMINPTGESAASPYRSLSAGQQSPSIDMS